MKSSYNKEKGTFNRYELDDEVPYRTEESSSLFHAGQTYEDEPAKKLVCKECGGDKFNVGKGCCFTVIRCLECEWEECVHDG